MLILVLIPMLTGCQPDDSAVLAFLGDINLGRDVNPGPDSFAYLQDHLSIADIVLANLESPLSDEPGVTRLGYNLCSPSEKAAFLAEWGIDLLSLVNNHSNDCSPLGMIKTQTALAAEGLIGLGSQPYHTNLVDNEITLFAFDDVSRELDLESAAVSVSSAHSAGAVVVVSIHWGMEYQGAPSDRQKDIAGELAEAGADIIWGHHPHVLQPVDWIGTSWGNSLVFYSLGNALFDQGGLDDTRQSALLLVHLNGGKVKTVEAVPFIIDVPSSTLAASSGNSTADILLRLSIPVDLLPSH